MNIILTKPRPFTPHAAPNFAKMTDTELFRYINHWSAWCNTHPHDADHHCDTAEVFVPGAGVVRFDCDRLASRVWLAVGEELFRKRANETFSRIA